MALRTVSFSRPRVKKACDRCKVKKCKCDGQRPCSRCKDMNSVCQFSGRKPYQNKVHPKGYVELLERQHEQCVAGLRVMYRWLRAGKTWTKPISVESDGNPRIHDLLLALNILDNNDPKVHDVGSFAGNYGNVWHREISHTARHQCARDSVISTSDDSVLSEVDSMNGKAVSVQLPTSFGIGAEIGGPLQASVQGREQAYFMSPTRSDTMSTFPMEEPPPRKIGPMQPWTWCAETPDSAFVLHQGAKDPWLVSGLHASGITCTAPANIMTQDASDCLDPAVAVGMGYGIDKDFNNAMFSGPTLFHGTGYIQYSEANEIAT